MIEYINNIEIYHRQIEAMLDLMQCFNDYVDMDSIRTVSEISQTMLDELMGEVEMIKKQIQNAKE